jgi:hypothetical protein
LTCEEGFDRGFDTIWTVGRGSSGPGPAQARQRRGAAGGDAVTAARRRRAAAQQRLGVGVLLLPRDLHQDDGERPTNTTVGFRGGDDGARRLTTSSGSGEAPVSAAQRRGAHARLQEAPAAPLPSGGGAETAA